MANKDLQKESKEKLELSPRETREGLRALGEAAKEVQEMDINSPYTLAMANVDVKKPLHEDKEGLTFMESEVINIVSKIAKKHPKANLSRITPENLSSIAQKSSISLRSSEVVALRKLDEIRLDPTSPLAEELEMIWPLLIEKAEEARMGLTEKYLKNLKKRPAETIIYTGAAIAGIYLGYKLIKWLVGKGKEKVEKKVSKFFSTGNILAFLGLGALGTYMGSDGLKEWLADKFGFKDERDKLKKLIEKLRKAKDPEEIKKLKKKVKDLAKKLQKVPEKVKKGAKLAKRIKEEKEWALVGKVSPEKKEKYISFSELTGKVDPNRKVSAIFFAAIDPNKKYEEFLKEEHGFFAKISNVARYVRGDVERNAKNLQELFKDGSCVKLQHFFTNILKNEGDFEEFKGKSIIKVMEMIQEDYKKGGDKYIDKKAEARAHKEYESSQKTKERLKKLATNPLLITNTEFASDLVADGAEGGYTFILPKAKKIGVWIVDNFGAAVLWESEVAYKALSKLADRVMEDPDDRLWRKAAGVYIQAGAYTVAIGAPLGTWGGFVKGIKAGSLSWAMKSAVKGTIGASWKAFTLPGKLLVKGTYRGVKGIFIDLPKEQFHPMRNIRGAIDQHLFFIEDLRLGFLGDKFHWRTWTERVLYGEIEINKRIMDKLATYENILTTKKNEMNELAATKTSKKKIYEGWAKRYQKMKKQIEKLTKFWDIKKGKFLADEWNGAMGELQRKFALSDDSLRLLKIGKEANVLNRLGIILLDREHPITQFIAEFKGKKANQFLELLSSSNKKVLNAFTRNPKLINDHHVMAALAKLDAKTLTTCERIILDRSLVWESLSRKELRLLDQMPKLAPRYTKLIEQIQKSLPDEKIECRLLRRIILNPKSRRAKFIYNYIDKLDDLFGPTNKEAIERFLAIDEKIFKNMGEAIKKAEKAKIEGFTNPFKELAKALSKNDEAVLEVVSKYEKKAGQTAKRLSELKAGKYEKVSKKIKGVSERLKRWRGPKFSGAELAKLVQEGDVAEIQKMLGKRGIQIESEMAELIAKSDDVEDIKYIIREVAKENGTLVKFATKIAKVGKVLRFVRPVVPGVFGAAAFAGAGIDFYQAAVTENAAKRSIYLKSGGVNTVVGAIDVGMLIGGASLGTMFWFTAATAPYLGMYGKADESELEALTTPEEWAQTHDHDSLVHHWMSMGKGITAGEAYRLFTPAKEIAKEHAKTKENMVKAILRSEAERFENENKYRLDYLKKVRNFGAPVNYEKARDILYKSRIYAEVMYGRSEAIKQSVPYKLGKLDLLEPQYDPEKIDKPTIEKVVNLYEKELLKRRVNPVLAKNFDKLSDGELVNFYLQLDKYTTLHQNEITDDEVYFKDQLKSYLFVFRKIDANGAIQNKYLKEMYEIIIAEKGEIPEDAEELKKAQSKAIQKILKDFDKAAVLSYMNYLETGEEPILEIGKEKITDNEACYALYELAKFFGYSGLQNEEELKAFFNEGHKDQFGLYWDKDDEAWYANEAGLERDDEVGTELNRQTIENIIKTFRGEPDDILAHKQDWWAWDLGDIYTNQVQQMAYILENALGKYHNEKQEKAPIVPAEEEELVATE